MPAAAAPPAPTPTPAPAPTPSPAPSPTPPSAPAGPTPNAERTFKPGNFDDIDHLGDDTPPPTPSGAPPVPTGQPEPPKGTPPPPDPAKGGAAAPTEPELDVDGVPKFTTNKDLRKWAVAQSKAVKEFQKKVTEAEDKLKSAEARGASNETLEALNKKLAETEKKAAEQEEKMRFLNYKESDEYKTKYDAPLNKAIDQAHAETEELVVYEPDPDGGDPTQRPATKKDFNKIYNAPTSEAIRLAKEMFGDAASIVLDHRREIKKLSKEADAATEDYRKRGSEIQQRRNAEETTMRQNVAQLWTKVNDEIGKKHPKWFGPEEGDTEGNELLQKGYALVDSVYGENRQKLTHEQRVVADATVRNRAAGFGRMALRVKRLSAALDEATKTIEQLRNSAPNGKGGAGGAAAAKAKPKGWEEALDDLPE